MKKIYQIELSTTDSMVAKETAILAALSNGGNYTGLDTIEGYAIAMVKQIGYHGVSVTRCSNHELTIDKTTGKETVNLLTLTEKEVMPLIDEDAPSLNRYTTGLADANHEGLIN